MGKKDKFVLIFFVVIISIIVLSKLSLFLNQFNISPIEHHTLSEVAECAEDILKNAKLYNDDTTVNCDCNYYKKDTYYKYTCSCNIKDKEGKLLQAGGSRILYEEKNTYKLKYNIWIGENKWYTGYCEVKKND